MGTAWLGAHEALLPENGIRGERHEYVWDATTLNTIAI
jgi:hypothetical protein